MILKSIKVLLVCATLALAACSHRSADLDTSKVFDDIANNAQGGG
jgi:hypothetical protein